MNKNKNIFLELVSDNDTKTADNIRYRIENKSWLKESKRIAIKILVALKEQSLSQKDLAEKMNVSPQYINKLVKGGENLTLDTITKLQNILQLQILVSSEKKISKTSSVEYKAEYKNNYIDFNPDDIFPIVK